MPHETLELHRLLGLADSLRTDRDRLLALNRFDEAQDVERLRRLANRLAFDVFGELHLTVVDR